MFSGVDQEITQVQVSDGRVLLNVRNLQRPYLLVNNYEVPLDQEIVSELSAF